MTLNGIGAETGTAPHPPKCIALFAICAGTMASRAALAAVLPLKETLARTATLIAQIVYRRYGLTSAEIAVVEGK